MCVELSATLTCVCYHRQILSLAGYVARSRQVCIYWLWKHCLLLYHMSFPYYQSVALVLRSHPEVLVLGISQSRAGQTPSTYFAPEAPDGRRSGRRLNNRTQDA